MGQETLSTRVRVLHAACFAPPVQVMVGSRVIADGLAYGMISDYQKMTDGFRKVSVMVNGNTSGKADGCSDSGSDSCNSEEIISDTLPFCGGRQMTLVICNTMNSISIVCMEDISCYAGRDKGCLRFANFSFGDGPFDVLDGEGNVVFSDIMPREVMSFLPALAGNYEFSVVQAGSEYVPESECGPGQDRPFKIKFPLCISAEKNCTACILGSCGSEMPLKIKVLES